MIKTAKELVDACLNVVNNYKTLYVMGCFGAPLNTANKTRYMNAYSFNRKEPHRSFIQNASSDTFGFDCVCFIKALLWGWNGNVNHPYGGATYKSNGVPDIGADQMIKVCTEVSTDFSKIQPGELVWLPGHVGIYVGDGLAAEATFEPESKVQLQCVLPMGVKPGMPATGWQKHGKLPYVSYEQAPVVVAPPVVVTPSKPAEEAKDYVFKKGDEVRLKPGATYTSGKSPATFIFKKKLYVREIRGNNIVISTLKVGAVTGIVAASNLEYYNAAP